MIRAIWIFFLPIFAFSCRVLSLRSFSSYSHPDPFGILLFTLLSRHNSWVPLRNEKDKSQLKTECHPYHSPLIVYRSAYLTMSLCHWPQLSGLQSLHKKPLPTPLRYFKVLPTWASSKNTIVMKRHCYENNENTKCFLSNRTKVCVTTVLWYHCSHLVLLIINWEQQSNRSRLTCVLA